MLGFGIHFKYRWVYEATQPTHLTQLKPFIPAQTIVKREINPKVYTKSEWQKLIKEENSFVKEILHAPKLFIIGTVNDIE